MTRKHTCLTTLIFLALATLFTSVVEARNYHPTMGRWVSRDPIEYRGGMSFYQYVYDNPIYFLDPYGLYPLGKRGEADLTIEVQGESLCDGEKAGQIKITAKVAATGKYSGSLQQNSVPFLPIVEYLNGEQGGGPASIFTQIGQKYISTIKWGPGNSPGSNAGPAGVNPRVADNTSAQADVEVPRPKCPEGEQKGETPFWFYYSDRDGHGNPEVKQFKISWSYQCEKAEETAGRDAGANTGRPYPTIKSKCCATKKQFQYKITEQTPAALPPGAEHGLPE
jgi:hypothetical protein